MNAIEKYNRQSEDNATMQQPFETKNGLYVWESWTFGKGQITDIRYFCQDVNGGAIKRISIEDYMYFFNNQ